MINFFLLHQKWTGIPAAIIFAIFLSACSAPPTEKYGVDDEAETLDAMRPKTESEVSLPAFPKIQDLLPVDTGPAARQTFAIDAKSLTVSPDHFVRYTVIATSSSGAKNISYEGIDCKLNELRRYAYSAIEGKWVRSRENKSVPVSSMSRNQIHYTLLHYYFCQRGIAAGDAKDIVSRIRSNTVLQD
jgi:hypothetical protein